jgi:hypothetical protein
MSFICKEVLEIFPTDDKLILFLFSKQILSEYEEETCLYFPEDVSFLYIFSFPEDVSNYLNRNMFPIFFLFSVF